MRLREKFLLSYIGSSLLLIAGSVFYAFNFMGTGWDALGQLLVVFIVASVPFFPWVHLAGWFIFQNHIFLNSLSSEVALGSAVIIIVISAGFNGYLFYRLGKKLEVKNNKLE